MEGQSEHSPMAQSQKFNERYFSADNYGVPGGYESYDNPGFWKNTLQAIAKYIPSPQDETYLDLGCAFGHLLKRVPFGKRVGVDIGAYPLRIAKERVPDPKDLVLSDVGKLPFADKSFDCITALDVVEHTPDFQKTIGEISRVLKNEGIFIVGTPITDTPEAKVWGKYFDKDVTHYSKPSRAELFQFLEQAGLEVLEFKYYFPIPTAKLKFPRTNIEVVTRKTNLPAEELRERHNQNFTPIANLRQKSNK